MTQYSEIMYDSQGRIFIYDHNNDSVDIFSSDIPTTIHVTPEHDTYNYTGSNIDSHLTVTAYNHLGDRVALDVELKLIGTNVTFNDGTTITTVTTSDSADVEVPIIIKGASFIRVSASVVV